MNIKYIPPYFAGFSALVRTSSRVLCLFLLCLPPALKAIPPLPFTAEYEARLGGLKAKAERSFQLNGDGYYEMSTFLELKIIGQTISSIAEHSLLESISGSDELIPLEYTFSQKGMGKRQRHIQFNWASNRAIASVNKQNHEIVLQENAKDNLSAYLEIREQLLAGQLDISFPGIDKNEIEEFHYRVLTEEKLETALGLFNTIKLERIRDRNSERITEIWLAPEWDYLLVKLVQKEPNSRTISLDLNQASVNNIRVSGIISEDQSSAD